MADNDQSSFDYAPLIRRLRSSRGDLPQAELARLSGVSNKTISEYERGIFGLTQAPRSDVLGRLALTLGEDPAEWLRLGNLEYDSIEIEQARRHVAARSPSPTSAGILGVSRLNTLEELRTMRQPVVRISISERDSYASFDREHIELLCSLINHRWTCDFHPSRTLGERIETLYASENRCHVAVGVLETLGRISGGLRFIPYPGLEYRINAIWAAGQHVEISWNDVRLRKKDVMAVTIRDEAADEYLRGVCGYDESSNNIFSLETQSPDEIELAIDQIMRSRSPRPVVFCAVEDMCAAILSRRPQSRYALVGDRRADREFLPCYRPGIVVRFDDKAWAFILERAQEAAIKSAPDRMALLYAEMLVGLIPLDRPFNHGYSFGRLHRLGPRELTKDFVLCLRRELMARFPDRAFRKEDYEQIAAYVLENAAPEQTVEELFGEIASRLNKLEHGLEQLLVREKSKRIKKE